MGTWGTGVFGGDLAADIRDEFRELIGDGVSPEDATRRLIDSYRDSGVIGCADDEAVFWIALAATQWKCGRLLDHVKAKALEVIDAGGDFAQWEEGSGPKAADARRRVLKKLREQLLSPQPKPTRIRKVFHDRTDWEVGHAIGYRLLSGKWVIFRVISIHDDKSRIPVVDLCDWVGDEFPSPADIAELPKRHDPGGLERIEEWRVLRDSISPNSSWNATESNLDMVNGYLARAKAASGRFTIYSEGPRDFPADRVRVVATGLRLLDDNFGIQGASFFGGWKYLDDYLLETFDLR